MDEYVRRSYKFAHADTLEVGPIACLPEPPEPRDPSIQRKRRFDFLDVVLSLVCDLYMTSRILAFSRHDFFVTRRVSLS